MSESLRRVEALPLYKKGFVVKDLGPQPEFKWVAPTDLYIDEEYQRDLTLRSYKLIDKIIQNFMWRRVKPAIVVEHEDGKLHCIDGQHTAIAAATRRIPLIPVFVVQADTLELRADAFVGHNRDRVVMDALAVYKGLLKAQDPDALDVHNVCERAGVRIKQIQSTQVRPRAGDSCAVSVISHLIKRHSPMKARRVLEALVKAGRAPITRMEIDACEALMLVTYKDATVEQVANVVQAAGSEGIIRARMRAVAEKRPAKHVLYEVYAKLLEEQKSHEPEKV